MPRPPFTHWHPAAHASLALAACLVAGWLAQTAVSHQRQGERQLQRALSQSLQPLGEIGAPLVKSAAAQANSPELVPSAWPPRSAVDGVVKAASEAAKTQGVAVRTLSVSHQPASANAWGKATLDASASGTYAALKRWQSGLQAQFPSLAVQTLRMQSASALPTPGGLEAQWTWVMHVRD